MVRDTKLPPTKVKLAKERLEELAESEVINKFTILTRSWTLNTYGQSRAYNDGFEFIYESNVGALYLYNQEVIFFYDLNKARELNKKT